MGSMVVPARLCILSLSILILTTSSYASHHVHALPSLEQAREAPVVSPRNSPRKLRPFEQVAVTIKGRGKEVPTAAPKRKEDKSGGDGVGSREPGPATMHGKDKRGTWREWGEGTDPTQYFTMDYSQVRRRRPIHNKSLPVGP
ncbi:protein GOLVEN 6-like isoform X2 [Rhodamnia argentea]|uniref:Protein GOLVEN 6-like isoform X2 n=1 Tax=Rhodamnia argentea TaxID=178133 RepID=A0A8B8MXA0_9MYRT|nr:protein GOLVEN 6-like isoform X2 [Rhodamnia argentea]